MSEVPLAGIERVDTDIKYGYWKGKNKAFAGHGWRVDI